MPTPSDAPQSPTQRVVEIGSPEFFALQPSDFDPEVCRKLLYFLLGPGWHGKSQPQDSTQPGGTHEWR